MKKRNMSWVALLLSFVLFFAPFPTSFAAVEPYVESDTTMDFTKAQGDYYWFKFTVTARMQTRRSPQETGLSSRREIARS